uniref:maturase n=1 Tax=Huperzia crispata TaxID=380486 RepID=UPI0023AB407A|nr:maturase [Huperzia crispata]WCP18589.1 maturase [Huperzia crispata]
MKLVCFQRQAFSSNQTRFGRFIPILQRERKRAFSRRENQENSREEAGFEFKSPPIDDRANVEVSRIRYVRYADGSQLGIVGPVELIGKIRESITHFLRSDLNLEVGSVRFTHTAAGTVEFLGTVIRGVPASESRLSRKLEKRRRVKHRIHLTASHRRSAIHSKLENLGKSLLVRQLTKGRRETGSLHLAGLQLAETLKTAGVSPQVSVLRETAKNIQQRSREILHSLGWSNVPSDIQQAVSRLDESLSVWMSSLETPRAHNKGRKGQQQEGGGWHEQTGSFSKLSIRIQAPTKKILQRLRDRGIISQRKARPTHVARLTNVSDGDIVNWFASIAIGLLSYYRCCDNLYQVRAIVDYQIRWSAIFTLAHKHKSSARNRILKHCKDLHIVNGEGKTLTKFPTSMELRKLF